MKKDGPATLTSDERDFKTKRQRRHYIMIKGLIQDNTTLIYAPIIRSPKYIKQILTDKGRN